MKNISPYSSSTFIFYKNVVSNKKINDLKDRLFLIQDVIEKQYSYYDLGFENDTLESLSTFDYTDNEKEDLKALYSYSSAAFQSLKISLTTNEKNRINNTCPYCTIGEIGSFDHYLPQSEFAEYAVNPKNLLPCCSICNGHKGVMWRHGGERILLNLYIDALPEQQFLFAKTIVEAQSIRFEYYLDNPNNEVDASLFKKISNQYGRLNLLQRFKENSEEVVTDLITNICSFENKSEEYIVRFILRNCEITKKTYGNSNYKIVLKEALIKNPDFLTFALNQS